MKKRILLPALLLTLAVGLSQAQTKKEKDEKSRTSSKVQVQSENGTTKVHVEKQRDGKTEVFDRSFSDQASADAFLDSVNAGTGNRMRITQRGGSGDRFEYNNDRNDNYNDNGPTPPKAPKAPKSPRVRIYGDDDKTVEIDMRNFERDMERFGRDMERWSRDNADRIKDLSKRNAEKMKEWGQKFERDFKLNWDTRDDSPRAYSFRTEPYENFFGNATTSSSRTVKSLSAYPNQPFNGRLNVSFQAPEKGDVTILVTDVNGKEVAREKVKDFSGKYVGQVDLKKSPEKGTFFLTVTQGVDGAVKRIVVE